MENVNFLPERIKTQRAKRLRLRRHGYVLAVCVAVMALLGYVRQGNISEAKAELALLDNRSESVQGKLLLRAALERQLSELLVKKRIDDNLGSRVKALDVLAELDQILPQGMALTKLSLGVVDVRIPIRSVGARSSRARIAKPGQRKKEKVVKRIQLTLGGLSPTDVDVANFIGQLSGSPVFEDVNMGYIKNVTFRGRAAREFQASCFVIR